MRYHYEKSEITKPIYGETYICDHPVYNRCTLYKIGDLGLAVIQQRHNPKTKRSWWTEIDNYLRNDLYLHAGFRDYFDKKAGERKKGLYPTVTVRQIMWALKMKPLQREPWETCFDHSPF